MFVSCELRAATGSGGNSAVAAFQSMYVSISPDDILRAGIFQPSIALKALPGTGYCGAPDRHEYETKSPVQPNNNAQND